MSNETQRPKTKKLRNATPNINLPIIDSQTNKFNWKTLSESNVYILKKLPEVNSKELSLNQLDQRLNNNVKNKINIQTKRLNRKELIKQNSSTSFKKDYQQNLEQFKTIRASANEYNRPSTNQKMQINIKCYLCNKAFNAKQIIIHETECLDKWRQLSSEEKRKAIEEHQINQKDCLVNLDEHQEPNQWKKFKSILSQCSKCGRNFFEHRLEKHELNCKGKQQQNNIGKLNDKLDSLTEDEKEEIKLNENSINDKIVFLRKTKPLNSRSNQLYKQSANLPTISNQFTSNPQLFNTESSDQSNPEIDNNELINKNNLINQNTQLNRQNYFIKCSVCGRVCNKANMDTHMKIHRRSNLIQQQSLDDNSKLDKSIEKLNDKLNINNLSLDNMKTFKVNAEKDSSSTLNYDNDLILENDKEILINLNIDQQKNNLVNLIENNLLNQINDNQMNDNQMNDNQMNDNQLMFSDEEWNEHLSKLKKCVKCNRTFFADRIKKHQDSCKAQPI